MLYACFFLGSFAINEDVMKFSTTVLYYHFSIRNNIMVLNIYIPSKILQSVSTLLLLFFV